DAGRSAEDGVAIRLVKMRRPSTEPTNVNQIRNIALTYIPGFIRMALHVWRVPADVVIASGAPLIPLALLHRWRHRSKFVLDVTERPGAVAAQGSASAVFSRIE